MRTLTTTFGQAMLLAMRESPGGLNRVVWAANQELGPIVGTRNTFAKLYNVEDARDLSGQERFRAWVALLAVGEDPAEWGIDEQEAIPVAIDQDRLRRELPRLVAGAGFEPATSGLRARLSRFRGKRSPVSKSDVGLAA